MTKRTFFAGSLLGSSLLFGWLALRQREVQTWVPSEGEVTRVWTKTWVQPPQETRHGSRPPSQVVVDWIGYSYMVDGRKYFGEAPASPASGRGFTVYYDSDHPEQSRLDKPEASPVAAIAAVLQFLGGIVLGLGGRRGKEIRR